LTRFSGLRSRLLSTSAVMSLPAPLIGPTAPFLHLWPPFAAAAHAHSPRRGRRRRR